MRIFLAFLAVGVAVGADALTFGGVCNDAYFRHGRRTYTQRAVDKVLAR